MLTKEQSIRPNKNIISSLLLLLVPFGGYLVYKDFNKTPTFYEGGTLTNYERTLKLDKQYEYVEGEIQNVPDTEYLGYFTFLKDGFNEHTISLTSEDKPKSIHKHVHFDTERDSVTNTFTTDGIVIDTNYKTTETKVKTLGAPTPQIKQTFILRNTTDEVQETSFTSTTRLNTNTVEYNGRTIHLTETPTILKAEEKTASIPEFASDIGYENPEETEQFENYTHTYRTPAFLTFETDEGTAVYDWRDAQHLNHTVTLYEHDNNFYLSFTVSDITIQPNDSFTIDPAYGLDQYQNYDVRYDGKVEVEELGLGGVFVTDVNGDAIADLILGTSKAHYGGANSGSVFVTFGTSTIATGTLPQNISTNYNIRYDGATGDQLTLGGAIAVGDVNGDTLNDLIIGGAYASNGLDSSGSVWVLFSTLIDNVGYSKGNVKSLATGSNFSIRYDGAAASDLLSAEGVVTTGDLNGDGYGDLILGSSQVDNNGDNSGSVWVLLSTLIDDVGTTTGNTRSLSVGSSYNIRYDGAEANDRLSYEGFIGVDDVNGDTFGDLLMGTYLADNGANNAGSVWVVFSTLIEEVGETTGNNRVLSSASDFNIRYDGSTASEQLARYTPPIVGDLNKDGFGDLVLGARYADYNGNDSGSAWVMFSTLIDDVGTSTGHIFSLASSTNYSVRYDGDGLGDNLTDSGAMAIGDVNGDGLNDLVLGESGADNNGGGSGSVYVIFSNFFDNLGTSTGVQRPLSTSTNYNLRYDGAASSHYLSRGEATTLSEEALKIGDINGDGLHDLVLGTYSASYNGYNSGSVWVVFSTLIDDIGTTTGNTRPLSTATNYNIRYDGANYADSLASKGLVVGDLNGDTLDDLIMTAIRTDNNGGESGSVWVMFSTLIDDEVGTGNNKSLGSSLNYSSRYDGGENTIKNLTAGAPVGRVMITGDINCDGMEDLVLGTPNAHYNGPYSGSVFVIFGTATTGAVTLHAQESYNIRYDGAATRDYLAYEGAINMGDVNGDGCGDLILGSSQVDNNGDNSGSVWVIFSTLIDNVGTATGNNFALSTSTNYNVRYDGGAASDYLTFSGSIASGDVNGDGLGDLILGAYGADNNGGGSGSAWVIFSTLIDNVGITTGNNHALSTSTNYNVRYDGPDTYDYLTDDRGLITGDVNGDGLGDLVLGSRRTDYNGASSGSVWIMFSTLIDDVGTTTGNNRALSTPTNYNVRYDGGAASDYLGEEGALVVGDVNGDDFGDLILGTQRASNNGSWSGSAWIMFSTLIDDVGTTTGNHFALSSSTDYNVRYDGPVAYDYLLAEGSLMVGDVNGDRVDDLVLGGYGADHNGAESGSAWVIFSTLMDDVGSTTGNIKSLSTSTNYNVRFDGPVSASLTDEGAIAVGDVNGDGMSDLLLGSWKAGNYSGSGWIMFSTLIDDVGTTTGNDYALSTSTNYNLRYDGSASNDFLTKGGALIAGDLNGDGLGDIALGASSADTNGGDSGSAWVIYSEPPPKYKMQGDVNFTGSVQFR